MEGEGQRGDLLDFGLHVKVCQMLVWECQSYSSRRLHLQKTHCRILIFDDDSNLLERNSVHVPLDTIRVSRQQQFIAAAAVCAILDRSEIHHIWTRSQNRDWRKCLILSINSKINSRMLTNSSVSSSSADCRSSRVVDGGIVVETVCCSCFCWRVVVTGNEVLVNGAVGVVSSIRTISVASSSLCSIRGNAEM